MRHVLFIGNSHLLALLEAAHQSNGAGGTVGRTDSMWRSVDLRTHDLELPGPEPSRARFVLAGGMAPPLVRIDRHGLFSVRRRYLQALDDAEDHFDGRIDLIVSCFLGNEHTIFSLMEHPVPFDVLVDETDEGVALAEPPRQVVPVEVVRRELSERANPTVLYCEVLRSRFPTREVVHVVPPPPIPDTEHIRRRPEVFGPLIEEFGVAPADLRRKVYHLYVSILRDRLSTTGVRLQTAPEESMDDGFLRAELWREATHADRQYGRLVLEQVGAT